MRTTSKVLSVLSIVLMLLFVPVNAHRDPFVTGSPTLFPTPNPPPTCASDCTIIVAGPTLGSAITFSQNNSVTGRFKVIHGPTPTNVTLSTQGSCTDNSTFETPISLNAFTAVAPLRVNQVYVYCLYYNAIPAATVYSVEVTYKHPGDVNFIQTIDWTIP